MLALTFLAVVSFFLQSTANSISSEPGKVYLWTWSDNTPNFRSQYFTKSLTADRASNHVSDLAKDYEVVVLLKPDNKDSKPCSFVQHSVQHATTHQIMPFVYPTSENSVEDSLEMALSAQPGSMPRPLHRTHLTEIESALEANPSLLRDGKPDVFVAHVGSESDVVEFSLTSRNLMSNNKKILFVSFDEGKSAVGKSQPIKPAGYSRILSTSSDLSDGVNYKPEGAEYSIYYQSKYLYITPDIFTGLMTFLFVAFVLMLGLSCLGSIQGMSSFYEKIPVVGKEA